MSYYNSYSPGTTFLDSITTGNFLQYGNGATGVPTGVAMVYSWKPKASSDLLTTPDSNPLFATPNGAYVNLSNSSLATGFEVVNEEVPLDVCRLILIAATQPFSVFGSCRDFYGNKMTFGGEGELNDGVYGFVPPRGVAAINSVKIFGGGPGVAIQIRTLDAIELPFADYNKAPISFINYNSAPLFCIRNDAGTPYIAKGQFEYQPSTELQTLDSGNPRPFILLANEGDVIPEPFNGERELVIGQNVTGYGFNKPVPPVGLTDLFVKQEQNQFLNLSTYVLGEPSFNEGWVGWQS